MKVSLIWQTPNIDQSIAYMARVSNPNATLDDPSEKLIGFLVKNKHWSPFEMANICLEIETTRDVSRQILRHRSFHYQEFSQRYSEVDETPEYGFPRLQDHKNRQNSIVTDDPYMLEGWSSIQNAVWNFCWVGYQGALKLGIAKEVARKLLPEGLTKTKMYMNGTVRDWLHYLAVRLDKGTQLEHREVAKEILTVLESACPTVLEAARQAGLIEPAGND